MLNLTILTRLYLNKILILYPSYEIRYLITLSYLNELCYDIILMTNF